MSVLYILGLLVAGGVGLLVGIKFRGAATKRDLAKTEWRIVQAFSERVTPESQRKIDEIFAKVTAGKKKVQGAIDKNK